MEFSLAKKAIDFVANHGSYLCIGGGEPTLHPHFNDVLMYAIAKVDEEIWLATNGSITQTSLALAKLADCGAIGCALSRDDFHGPIDPIVVRAFERRKEGSGKEIRNCMTPSRAGRWKIGPKKCACPETTIDVYGRVRQCGCPRSTVLGSVLCPPVAIDFPDRCYKTRGI